MSVSTNTSPSGYAVPIGAVDPQSLTGGAASSAWLSAKDYHKFAVLFALGAVAATGTPTLTAEQATSVAGAGAKALNLNGAASVAKGDADDNKQFTVDVNSLDVENGFTHFRVTVTNAPLVAALVAAVVLGMGPRNEAPNKTT